MYCDFYQLRERPFNVTADPKFLYLNARYREALASLHYGISQRKGFIALIGEAGTGKTTLLKKLLDDLDAATRTVFIFNTNVTFDEILEYIFGEFDLPVLNGKRLYMLQRLNSFLLEELRNGRNVALLIDEAQDLDYSVLEDLRLLSNLETAKEKILQIVLSGQPELGQKLGNPGLRQLRQRVAVNCRLLPLTREELSEYIQARLTAAGSADPRLFSRDAEDRIFEISTGIPRLVNIVCDNALVIGYALGKRRIGADVVNEAAADLLTIEAREAAATGSEAAPSPATDAGERTRSLSQLGVVAVVVVAILIGLLSVGRSLLRRDTAPGERLVASRTALEVIQAGTRGETRREAGPALAAPSVREGPGGVASVPDVHRAEGNVSGDQDALGERRDNVRGSAVGEPQAADGGESVEGETVVAELPADHEEQATDRLSTGAEKVAAVPAVTSRPVPSAGAVGRQERPAVTEADFGSTSATPSDKRPDVREEARGPAGIPSTAGAAVAMTRVAPAPTELSLAMPNYQTVMVRPGDSVSEIASRTYGQASPTILDMMKIANPSIRDIDVIAVGQELRLPRLDEGSIVLQQPDGAFALLLLSTPIDRRAQEIGSALRQRGFEAGVGRADFGAGRRVSRVLIGDLRSREEALAVGKELQRLFREDEQIPAMAR